MRAVADAVHSPLFSLSLCAALAAAPCALAAPNRAPKVHVVNAGQRLESIAKRYGVTVDALRRANAIGAKSMIRPGQRLAIPDPKEKGRSTDRPADAKAKSGSADAPVTQSSPAPDTHRVARGDTLSQLAIRYDTSVETLTALNGLGKEQSIREGQVLILPSTSKSRGTSWQRYARTAQQKGRLNVVTSGSRFAGLMVDSEGRLRPPAVRALNNLLGAGGSHPALPERLIRILIKLSDTFGGRSIRVVSGYRTTSYYEDSRHKLSSAVDFTVIGVPNAVLCEYLRGLENVGVGYYPNSSFVHLDVRGHAAYWVDYSGPGEPPRLSPDAPALPRREERRLLAELDDLLAHATAGLEPARPATGRGKRGARPSDDAAR